ncbi:hypothetical protein AURDEDRAFT_113026 [Auricularia subglabra TFB-10046 SS5]|nr:hypothetical protein AURDEDRAFT_113026 [Auricularia subglabra TFB-10046 SS5]
MSQHSASPPPAESSVHEDEGGAAMAIPEGAVPVHPMMAAPLVAQEYPQRKRVRLACSNCHRGKIKCDGERPCDRCLKKGLAPEECIDFQRKRTACTSCRAVKMKCDGNRPCKRCVKKGKGEECTDVDLPGVRPRREHRLKHNDGSVDDEHRPIPYAYDANAAAVAGYYYGAPPWAYHPHHPEASWHPYMYPYPQPPQNGEEEGRRGEYTAPLRSSYPDMPVDPALDPELLRQAQQSGQQPNMPAGASEGWSNILRTAQANGFYSQNGEGEGEGEDGEGAGEGEEGDGEGGEGEGEGAAEPEVKDEEDNDEE